MTVRPHHDFQFIDGFPADERFFAGHFGAINEFDCCGVAVDCQWGSDDLQNNFGCSSECLPHWVYIVSTLAFKNRVE